MVTMLRRWWMSARWHAATWILFGRQGHRETINGMAPVLAQLRCLDRAALRDLFRHGADLDLGPLVIQGATRAQNLRLLNEVARELVIQVVLTHGLSADDQPVVDALVAENERRNDAARTWIQRL